MHTQKVAITIPKALLTIIDTVSRDRGLSRSRYITIALEQKVAEEKAKYLKDAYDRVFSDKSIREEQLSTSEWFEGTGDEDGQEW